jgi:hypothetical protein
VNELARNVVVEVACDLCGADAASGADTQFAFEGQSFSIDLCAEHRDELGQALEPYVSAAAPQAKRGRHRVANPSRPAAPRAAGRRDPAQTGAIREWARANGFTVSDRGRIPQEVENAYNAKGK